MQDFPQHEPVSHSVAKSIPASFVSRRCYFDGTKKASLRGALNSAYTEIMQNKNNTL